ncbi:hypothetical protein [Streptomyces pratensis]|uniref:hypothetical protein n=1 Tax=Streptomyces pratensis TaxID=1169025 RepID=UPI003633B33D
MHDTHASRYGGTSSTRWRRHEAIASSCGPGSTAAPSQPCPTPTPRHPTPWPAPLTGPALLETDLEDMDVRRELCFSLRRGPTAGHALRDAARTGLTSARTGDLIIY